MHSPETSLTAVQALRDLLARWTETPPQREQAEQLAIVYVNDDVAHAAASLCALPFITAEGHEARTCAEVLFALASVLQRMDEDGRDVVEDGIYRFLPAISGHHNDADLARALRSLEDALRSTHRNHAADKAAECRRGLERDSDRLRP
jgi:hypothetical protein